MLLLGRRTRAWVARPVVIGSVALGAIVLACGGSSDSEARALLHQLKGLELDAPMAERQARIGRLKELALRADDLVAARDACVRAHQRLLEAEVAQAEAKRDLASARLGPGDGSRGPAMAHGLERSLQRSEDALSQARAAFPACRDLTRSLAKKYR